MLNQPESLLVLRSRPPVVPAGLVRRPRPVEMLTVGAGKPLTLLSAGPGSGKTLTVASWAVSGAADGPVAWLSLDDSDNDLRTFWSGVLFAVIASGGVPAVSSLRDITPTEFGATELLQALIAAQQRRDVLAVTAVMAAIELAVPEGIRRPFLYHDHRLADLLVRYQHLGGQHDAFASDLIRQLVPQHRGADDGAVVVDHLSEREAIVLHYLPTMLKTAEIAAELHISVNTVKSHLRSVYRKLGVATRRDAVERARTLGLL